MKKKLLSVLLCLTMAVSMLAGCGAGEEELDPETQAMVDKAIADPEYAPVEKEDMMVGVIHIGDPAAGSGYSYAHDQGIVGIQKNIGITDDQIVRKNNVADDDPTAIEAAIEECIEEGCILIFATSYGYMDTCEKLSEEHPDIIFSHGTGYKGNGTNFNNYFGRIYQARYLSGIAA